MNQKKNFIARKENFVCKNCGTRVEGTGYTNHCPNCLYSLHIDEEIPGDRLSKCLGLMEPVGIEMKKGEYVIIHRCIKCGKIMKNKAGKNDDFGRVVEISELSPSVKYCRN